MNPALSTPPSNSTRLQNNQTLISTGSQAPLVMNQGEIGMSLTPQASSTVLQSRTSVPGTRLEVKLETDSADAGSPSHLCSCLSCPDGTLECPAMPLSGEILHLFLSIFWFWFWFWFWLCWVFAAGLGLSLVALGRSYSSLRRAGSCY